MKIFYRFENQMIIGSVLGGSTLFKPKRGKNYCLIMQSKNLKWLKYKTLEMSTIFDKNVKVYHVHNAYRCISKHHPMLTEMRKLLYKNNKRIITNKLLDVMKDISFAVWYMENGGKTGRDYKNVYLNTTKFDEKSCLLMCDFLNEVGMYCKFHIRKNRKVILFTVRGSINFLNMIYPQLPFEIFKKAI